MDIENEIEKIPEKDQKTPILFEKRDSEKCPPFLSRESEWAPPIFLTGMGLLILIFSHFLNLDPSKLKTNPLPIGIQKENATIRGVEKIEVARSLFEKGCEVQESALTGFFTNRSKLKEARVYFAQSFEVLTKFTFSADPIIQKKAERVLESTPEHRTLLQRIILKIDEIDEKIGPNFFQRGMEKVKQTIGWGSK